MAKEARRRPRLSRRKRVMFGVVVGLLVYGSVEVVAGQMYRLARWPAHIKWAVDVVRAGGSPFRYSPHLYTFFMPTPEYVDWTGAKQHNRLGFRGPEIAVPKPAGVYRVVCLGGSTTYSVGAVAVADSFPARLEEYLRAATALRQAQGGPERGRGAANDSIEVINAGAPGMTSAEVLQTFVLRVLPLEPDLVVLHVGINDCGALEAAGHRFDYANLRVPFVLPRYSRLTRVLLRSPACRLVFARTMLPSRVFWGLDVGHEAVEPQTPEPTAFRTNVGNIILLAQGKGIGAILVNEHIQPGSKGERILGRLLGVIRDAGEETALARGAPICHFEQFPTTEADWHDWYHLKPPALKRKAAFVGRDIMAHGLVPVRVPGTTRPVPPP